MVLFDGFWRYLDTLIAPYGAEFDHLEVQVKCHEESVKGHYVKKLIMDLYSVSWKTGHSVPWVVPLWGEQ